MTKDRFKNTELIKASLKQRYARERRFQLYGKLAVLAGFVTAALAKARPDALLSRA